MSKIEVNAIEPQCGTTLTLGASGDTVALASGASQTGFGRTGTVDWQTGSIKTGTFVPVSGEGYFVDTSGGVSTANLPAGSAGAIVSFSDYTRTFQTNNLTIVPNGSEKIGGVAASFYAQTEGQSITLVYVDATEGWINTAESTGQAGLAPAFITATGGTITTVCTDYKVHTFTGPGTFCVSCAGNPLGSTLVDYLVVAGGGGAGLFHGGGGGAGGYRESPGTASGSYTVSPLGVAPAVALPVSVQGYPIDVGGGGVGTKGPTAPGGPVSNTGGSNSIFSTITSAGGGKGGGCSPSINQVGGNGGSGGGGNNVVSGLTGGAAGGLGNTPPVSPSQGNDGGSAGSDDTAFRGGGGGGGATTAGANVNPSATPTSSPDAVGPGGAGATSSINGTPTARAGGGGGGSTNIGGTGGTGGGGSGGTNTCNTATAGTINTGSGGGGGGAPDSFEGKGGGSGIVIIRYKFQ